MHVSFYLDTQAGNLTGNTGTQPFPGIHETLTQCWYDDGPASQTLFQYFLFAGLTLNPSCSDVM